MFGDEGDFRAVDVIRSMLRLGFSRDEIYDVMTCSGLPGEEVQPLIDKSEAEFEDPGFEPRPSKMASEVGDVVRFALREFRSELKGEMDSIACGLELLKGELEERTVELQELMIARGHEDRGGGE